MLWEGGIAHEEEVLSQLKGNIADLRHLPAALRSKATLRALSGQADYVLGGVIRHGDLHGEPDILRRRGGMWQAGDLKSGCPTDNDGRLPKKDYAVQVAFYASILAEMNAGDGSSAFVIGRDGVPIEFDLEQPCYKLEGRPVSPAAVTAMLTTKARRIRDGEITTKGAASAACKMCHWYSHCAKELTDANDLTLIAGVGRAVRDELASFAPTIASFAHLDLSPLIKSNGKTMLRGLGSDRIRRFQERARLLCTPHAIPFARRDLALPTGQREIHFDIEADPMRDGFVYLHGFLFREPQGESFSERYEYVFAEKQTGEEEAFREAMKLLTADPHAHIYYYSKYERSSFRALAKRYPDVCTREDIDQLFARDKATDLLFDIIAPHTEWPTNNHSIKTLARYQGFEWRDTDASGAASIAWFHDYLETQDPAVKNRILAYNEDDVRASAAVLDGLRVLPVASAPAWPTNAG